MVRHQGYWQAVCFVSQPCLSEDESLWNDETLEAMPRPPYFSFKGMSS